MSFFLIVKRSLVFFWRTNLGVLLAVAVGTTILAGALLVGDSVRYSLARLVDLRLGAAEVALDAPNRFFRSQLADDLSKELDADVAPVLRLKGLTSNDDGSRRTGRVEVIGADERFFAMGNASDPFEDGDDRSVVLNRPLAERLKVKPGDEVMLRFAKPGLMPRDVPLTPDSDLSIGFRLTVKAIASEADFGRFSLQANQVSPFNAFVPLKWLGEQTEHAGHANMLLVGRWPDGGPTVENADEAIKKCFELDDIALQVRPLPEQGQIEVISRRIFIDDVLEEAVTGAADESVGILTYLVNELRVDPNSTPYSFVTATDKGAGIIPADMFDDDIVINSWLANDTGAKLGDKLTLSYYVMGPMRKLQIESRQFTVRQVVPIAGDAADAQLMPDFPGLADADNCRDWRPGITIDLDKIGDEDEEYWDIYRGVPKAFVTLAAGQSMWANRFGKLTAVRYAAGKVSAADISSKILQAVDPASVGLFFQPVRRLAQQAGAGGTDFGGLFLGLSMFLIASAVILLGLVFVFGVEKRSSQSGILLALGFSQKTIGRLYLAEGALISTLGAIAGVIIALIYTRVMTLSLSSVWKDAIGGSVIHFHATFASLLIGAVAGIVISLIAIALTLRKQLKKPATTLLSGNIEDEFLAGSVGAKRMTSFYVGGAAFVAAVGILLLFGKGDGGSVSGAFFGAGALLLIGVLALWHGCLRFLARRGKGAVRSVWQLGVRNTTRRSGRSLAVVSLLAAGCFLVISVGAFREDAAKNACQRDSGTGGFALFGESSIPVLHDLSSSEGRDSLHLDDEVLTDLEVVQMRVRDGDDASCLNLNRPQRPRLIGVDPGQLQSRGAFTFVETVEGANGEEAWQLLNMDLGEDVVPAIGDEEMIKWMLGKSVGDELVYTDQRGEEFRLRLVGGLKNSILQGSLAISAEQFEKRFSSEAGFRMFLVDSAPENIAKVEVALSSGLVDFGLELTPAVRRMAQLNAVKNTYLSIFQLLGGLGLVLGSVGLGLVVLLNVLERRGEFGMLRAVGFSRDTLKKMVLYEHTSLVVAGISGGIISALIAIAPAMSSPGSQLPYGMLLVIIASIAASAVAWIWAATIISLGGNLLDAIRNE